MGENKTHIRPTHGEIYIYIVYFYNEHYYKCTAGIPPPM